MTAPLGGTGGGAGVVAGTGGAAGDPMGGGDGARDGWGPGGVTGAGGGDEEEARREIWKRVQSHRRYPVLARRRHIEGTVVLSLAVRADGSADVAIVRGADPMLDQAAREAVVAAAPLPRLRQPVEIALQFVLLDE